MAWTERYVDATASGGGTGASASDPWTLAEACANTSAGMRVNFKAGAYTNTASLICSAGATIDNPCWWRGYKTTPGDLDNKFVGNLTDSTDMPYINHTANYLILNDPYHHLTGISMESSSTGGPALYDRTGFSFRKNCRFKQSAARNFIIDTNIGFLSWSNCEFISTDSGVLNLVEAEGNIIFLGCVFKGTGNETGIFHHQAHGYHVSQCVFQNLNVGITMSNDHCSIFNNTFVDITDDAIFNSSTNFGYLFSGNYFYNVGGYCFGNSATNGNATALIQNNAYYNSPNRIEAPGNMTEFDAVVETSDEFVDKANGDYTLKATSGGYGYGIGGYWSLPMTDYRDIGAVQHQNPAITPSAHPLGQ